jgi:hypothetical protein
MLQNKKLATYAFKDTEENVQGANTAISFNPLSPELFFKFLHTLYLKCE